MKLIIAIINKDDSNFLSKELISAGFAMTTLNTTGGFLRSENYTALIGVEDDKVDEVFSIIEKNCRIRKALIPSSLTDFYPMLGNVGMPLEVTVGGATVFVVDVTRFEKI